MPPAGTKAAETLAGTLRFFCLLWLAGLAMRMTLLVVPPVIPLIHEDLRMSETQIGLLIGLPLALFAVAAVPGSLLIARGGAKLAVILGMVITAFAGGLRGSAVDVWTLYTAAIATGFGIAIMQPGMPTLVREWLPSRHRPCHRRLFERHGRRRDPAAGAHDSVCPAAGRRQLAAQFSRLGRAGGPHLRGVFAVEPEGNTPLPRSDSRDRRPMVAELEESPDLAARLHVRQ